jgi:hypothetical protein
MPSEKHGAPRRAAVCVLVAALAALAVPAGASAATGSWNCTASALRATLTNQAPIEPIIANKAHALCQTDSVGVQNLGPSALNLVGADAANAVTTIDSSKAPAYQKPTSYATVANLTVTNTGTGLLKLPGTVSSQVSAACVNGKPVFSATSTTAPIEIGGQMLQTDKPLTETLGALGKLTGAVVTIDPGAQTQTATSLTREALHVTVHLGSSNILDLVLASSTVSLTGLPCADKTPPPGSAAGAAALAKAKLLLAELKAGYDQYGARVENTKVFNHGRRTRIRIGCWRRHPGLCRVKVVVFRKEHPWVVGQRRIAIRPGHIKVIWVSTTKYTRYPVFVHLLKG